MMKADNADRSRELLPGPRANGRDAGSGCVRCGYPVPDLVMGCKAPCLNCRFLYPAGDCSD